MADERELRQISRSDVANDSLVEKREGLGRALLRGLAWTGCVKWLSQLLSWLVTVIVARLLHPTDYALVAMAGVFLGFIGLLNEFGLGAAVVALRDLKQEQIAKINTLAWCLGVATLILSCLVAVPAGYFFREPNVSLIIVVAGIGFVLVAMRSVPSALYEKELNFKFLAILEAYQAGIASLVTLVSAWWGLQFWALVLGSLMGSAMTTAVLLMRRPLPHALPSPASLKEVIRFSTHVLISRVSWYVASSSDVFVAGRKLGHDIVGAYSFAFTLANIPVDKVTALASRVMPAFYSAVQNDKSAIGRYFLYLTEAISIATFPLGLGFALVAKDFIIPVLGEKWQGAIIPLEVLACWAAIRSVVSLLAPVMYMTDGSRLSMRNGLFCAVTYPIAFWIGSSWGAIGIALGWVFIQPMTWVSAYRHVFAACDLSMSAYFGALWPALTGVAAMGASIWGMQEFAFEGTPGVRRLCVEVIAGGSIYLGMLLAFHRQRLQFYFELVKGAQCKM